MEWNHEKSSTAGFCTVWVFFQNQDHLGSLAVQLSHPLAPFCATGCEKRCIVRSISSCFLSFTSKADATHQSLKVGCHPIWVRPRLTDFGVILSWDQLVSGSESARSSEYYSLLLEREGRWWHRDAERQSIFYDYCKPFLLSFAMKNEMKMCPVSLIQQRNSEVWVAQPLMDFS